MSEEISNNDDDSDQSSASFTNSSYCIYCNVDLCMANQFRDYYIDSGMILDMVKDYLGPSHQHLETLDELLHGLDDLLRSKVRGRLYYQYCSYRGLEMR